MSFENFTREFFLPPMFTFHLLDYFTFPVLFSSFHIPCSWKISIYIGLAVEVVVQSAINDCWVFYFQLVMLAIA